MSRLTTLLRLVAAALALAAPPALSAQGDLDLSFGTGGIVQTDLDGPLLATPDGKLIVAGSDPGGMRVSRWLPSGALDTSFGTGGSVLIGLRQAGSPNGIYRQSTGAIVVVGSYSSSADGAWLAFARLATNGAPDPSFGVDGLRILALGGTGQTGTRSGAGVGVQPTIPSSTDIPTSPGTIPRLGRRARWTSCNAWTRTAVTTRRSSPTCGRVSPVASTAWVSTSLWIGWAGRWALDCWSAGTSSVADCC